MRRPVVQPDVIHGQADGLADPQTRASQQTEQCGEHGRSQTVARQRRRRGRYQRLDLCVGKDVGSASPVAGQEPMGRDLRAGYDGRQVGEEAPRDHEPVRLARVPAARWGVIAGPHDRGHRPDRYAGCGRAAGVVEEATQQAASRAGGEAEGVANSQVGLEVLVEVDVAAHRTPPIQGSATLASASRSSLA